jgi:hypothetical protein
MVLQISSSFSLYMYLEVDNYVIQPGLLLVDQLAMVNADKALSNDTFFDQSARSCRNSTQTLKSRFMLPSKP